MGRLAAVAMILLSAYGSAEHGARETTAQSDRGHARVWLYEDGLAIAIGGTR